jgi:hypothetical protein
MKDTLGHLPIPSKLFDGFPARRRVGDHVVFLVTLCDKSRDLD